MSLVDSLVFEVTQRCDHACPHCYNVWKGPGDRPPAGELDTAATLAMLDAVLDETGARRVTLSGGEPLLRADLPAIATHLAARRVEVVVATSGGRLDDDARARLRDAVSVWELPLLSARPELHDRLSGRPGAHERATRAIARLKAGAARVFAVFVAMRANVAAFAETAEVAFALGVDGLLFNRFNPGGAGAGRVAELQASPGELAAALDAAERAAEDYQLPVVCTVPMPPCLFERARWPHVGFSACAAGTARGHFALDALGRLRPCNHSPRVLGDVREAGFRALAQGSEMVDFRAARPAECEGCAEVESCQGGCKAAAEACYGSPWKLDPFLATFSALAHR